MVEHFIYKNLDLKFSNMHHYEMIVKYVFVSIKLNI